MILPSAPSIVACTPSRRRVLRFLAAAGIGWATVPHRRAMGEPPAEEPKAYAASFPTMGSTLEMAWIPESPDGLADGGNPRADGRADELVRQVRAAADTWEAILSDYQQESECLQVGRAADGGDWITPSDLLWSMLEACDRWFRTTEGAFDAGLGALTQLRRRKRASTPGEWQEARERCGWNHLELDMAGRRFRSHRPGVRFDFGAIGKGFVLDRLGETLRSLGVERYFLNASGNMLCGAPPQLPSDSSEARGWPVSIATLGQPDRELQRRRLVHRGIATSGDQYQRFPDSSDPDGVAPTSHIVDPLRRRGLDMPCMATVLGPRAADADALATACCVLLQRGTLASWLDRHEEELQGLGMEMVLQSARGEGIRLTSVACDW